MLQRKQRRTYLPDQSITIVEVGVAKSKLDDMASPVAAPDACPVTAVVILLPMEPSLSPREKNACWVACDALLELQERFHLVRIAAHANTSVMSSCRLGLLLLQCLRDHEEVAAAGGSRHQQQESCYRAAHGRSGGRNMEASWPVLSRDHVFNGTTR